jgi:hypothetical protein
VRRLSLPDVPVRLSRIYAVEELHSNAEDAEDAENTEDPRKIQYRKTFTFGDLFGQTFSASSAVKSAVRSTASLRLS